MRVVDTSAWIECLAGTKTGALVAPELPDRESWLVPTVVQLELAKWAMREGGATSRTQVLAFSVKRQVIDLNTKIALRAAEIWREHKLSTADAIIYATALEHNADLLTCDTHFEGLERVVMVGKSEG